MRAIDLQARAALQAAFEGYKNSSGPDPLRLRTIADKAGVLPVFRGWTALGAIRLDGVPVEVSYDPPNDVTVIADGSFAEALLRDCALKYPSLAKHLSQGTSADG
jgi:hypothetical protein